MKGKKAGSCRVRCLTATGSARHFEAALDTRSGFEFEPPAMLFEGRYAGRGGQPPSYDVAPDGRFLMIQSVGDDRATETRLHVVLNWFEELKRLTGSN